MKFEGYEIVCDTEKTKQYHDKYNAQCDCDKCKNFRLHFASFYPELVKLLSQFGIDIMYPLEIMDLKLNKENNNIEYLVYYSVEGELPTDRIETKCGNTSIMLRNWNVANEAYANTGMEKPYFIVEIGNIFLPYDKQ